MGFRIAAARDRSTFIDPNAAAPGEDPPKTLDGRPLSCEYLDAIASTAAFDPARANTATTPPLPPPVIFAPYNPAPAFLTRPTSASVPFDPSPHAL